MKILGINIITWLISIAIYIVAVVFGTEIIKTEIWFIDPKKEYHPLILSWILGLIIYGLLVLIKFQNLNPLCIVIFIVLTGLLNTGYKFTKLKKLIKFIIQKVM